MRKLLSAFLIAISFIGSLALVVGPEAIAQCNGVFPANTICGKLTSSGIPGPLPNSTLTGVPGGSSGQIQFNNNGNFGGVSQVPTTSGGTGTSNFSVTALIFGTSTSTVATSTLNISSCRLTALLGGTSFYTYTVGAANTYANDCAVRIINTDNTGNGNGKTLAINGYSNFILWPNQAIDLLNEGNTWRFNAPGHWDWTASHTFFVCHSNGSKTFQGNGTSDSGMVASDNNDGLTINTPFATLQHAIETLASQVDTNNFANTVQQCNETFTENVNNNRTLTGYHIVAFRGDPTSPGNVVWACGASAVCANARDFGILTLDGFKMCANTSCSTAATGANAIQASQWGNIDWKAINFGPFENGNHIECLQGGGVNFTGTSGYTISGGTNGGAHIYMQGPCHVVINAGAAISIPTSGLTIGKFLEIHGSGANVSVDPSTTFTGAGAGSGTTGQQYVYDQPSGPPQLNGVTLPGATGPIPVLSSCGTSPSVSGDRYDARITMGTSAAGCTITFTNSFTNRPFCVVTWQANLASMAYTLATTSVVITQTATSSNTVNYHCREP